MRGRMRIAAVAAAGIGAALAAATDGTSAARAQTGATGELGTGGTAVGDVSLDAGDEDAIGVELGAGSAFDVRLAAPFAAELRCTDPAGTETTVALTGTKTRLAKSVAVAVSGRHVFRVRSTDGRQGAYALTITPKWPARATVKGAVGTAATFPLAAGATVKGRVVADRKAGAWDPQVTSFTAPDGAELLAAPVAGKKGAANVGPVTATESGPHSLTVEGAADGTGFTVAFTARVPRAKPAKLDLRNGLTTISFEQDGVKALLASRCVACHVWAGSAAAFKPHAKTSLGNVVNGTMPQTGPRLTGPEIALLRGWIETGMKP